MTNDFVCPRADCGHLWSMDADEYGLFDGYGNPPCPICGTNGSDPSDYGEWVCLSGHSWRVYGNGGLVLGTVPRCPEHGTLPVNA